MNMGGARLQSPLVVLRNIVWAAYLVNENGGTTRKILNLYPRTGSGGDSTLFFKTLNTGLPSPAVLTRSGDPGPALIAEREFPGSLVWLHSPIWPILANVDFPFIDNVYIGIGALPPAVRDLVLSGADTNELLRKLHAEGSLDAIAAVVLVARHAFCLLLKDDFDAVASFARTQFTSWNCLAWMPAELRCSFVNTVVTCIQRCEPRNPDLQNAVEAMLEGSLLLDERAIYAKEAVEALSLTIDSSRRSEAIERKNFQLSADTLATLRKRVDEWTAAGAP